MKKFWGVQSFLVLFGGETECDSVEEPRYYGSHDVFVPRKSRRDWNCWDRNDEPLFNIKLKERVILDILDWCEQ